MGVLEANKIGVRPVLIIQNDSGNKHSSTVIALSITSKRKPKLPTHIFIIGGKFGLKKDSIILAEQIRTIDKKRLIKRVGMLDLESMKKVKKALEISFGFRGNISFNKMIYLILKNDS